MRGANAASSMPSLRVSRPASRWDTRHSRAVGRSSVRSGCSGATNGTTVALRGEHLDGTIANWRMREDKINNVLQQHASKRAGTVDRHGKCDPGDDS